MTTYHYRVWPRHDGRYSYEVSYKGPDGLQYVYEPSTEPTEDRAHKKAQELIESRIAEDENEKSRQQAQWRTHPPK